MMRRTRKSLGFSLIETLVAGTILSGTVLAVLATSTRSIGTTRLNRQYEKAASLAEKQLTLIDFLGIDEFIEAGRLEGLSQESEPAYHWQVETEYQDIDSLYRLTMTVMWVDRGRPHSLVVETMLNGESLVLKEESEGNSTEDGGDAGGGSAPSGNTGGGGGGNSAPSGNTGGGGGGNSAPSGNSGGGGGGNSR
jgi:hypothetical protein